MHFLFLAAFVGAAPHNKILRGVIMKSLVVPRAIPLPIPHPPHPEKHEKHEKYPKHTEYHKKVVYKTVTATTTTYDICTVKKPPPTCYEKTTKYDPTTVYAKTTVTLPTTVSLKLSALTQTTIIEKGFLFTLVNYSTIKTSSSHG
ncbi:13935_t:CDS:2 [Acaulospora morrowiae]|uniref:13935_t:CDS:1 n=1 Tax=Acaulospora morrowiae TaxID=94023 RepID=A0A9N9ESP0_9GLOM|nr:13935_t:CDS:2 [Acaulospora morrowiae]